MDGEIDSDGTTQIDGFGGKLRQHFLDIEGAFDNVKASVITKALIKIGAVVGLVILIWLIMYGRTGRWQEQSAKTHNIMG